jgi:hypothetical protein
MNQSAVSHQESEQLTAFPKHLPKACISLYPSPQYVFLLIPLDVIVPKSSALATQYVQKSQEFLTNTLKLTNYTYGFYGFAFRITYKKSLQRLAELNPKILTRSFTESAWKTPFVRSTRTRIQIPTDLI